MSNEFRVGDMVCFEGETQALGVVTKVLGYEVFVLDSDGIGKRYSKCVLRRTIVNLGCMVSDLLEEIKRFGG